MKYILIFYLIVVTWQSTTAKKLKCSEVSESPAPVTKTTTICPKVTCRNRYVWLQEACECVCPPRYCPEGTIRGGDCDCIPDTTMTPTETTPELCEPAIPCNRSWFWNYETCACQLGCDYIRTDCGQGLMWDIFECDCIEACPGVVCDENMVPDSEFCDCVPIDITDTPPETTLPDCGKMACDDGFDMDPFTCQCLPINPTGSTPGFCPEPLEGCKDGYFWATEPFCECWRFCDYIMECPLGEKWDFDVCGCVTDPDFVSTPSPCPPCDGERILNMTTCACDCLLTEDNCPGPLSELDLDMCTCLRHPCDPPYPCPLGEMISWEVCNCVPDPAYGTTPCPPCYGNNVLNTTSCDCVCHMTEDDCPWPRSELRFDLCECVMHPCDPPSPCPKGQVIDWEVCNCVKDPNATTRKSTRKPKGRQSEDSSSESASKDDKSDESRKH